MSVHNIGMCCMCFGKSLVSVATPGNIIECYHCIDNVVFIR